MEIRTIKKRLDFLQITVNLDTSNSIICKTRKIAKIFSKHKAIFTITTKYNVIVKYEHEFEKADQETCDKKTKELIKLFPDFVEEV